MQIKKYHILALILFLCQFCYGEEESGWTKDKVLSVLKYNDEGTPPGGLHDFIALRDAGENAYPAMAEILLETNDNMLVGGLASVFVQSKGDKAIPLEAMLKYIEVHKNAAPSDKSLYSVISAVGEIGGLKELKILNELSPIDPLVGNAIEISAARIEKRLGLSGPGTRIEIDRQKAEAYSRAKKESKISSSGAELMIVLHSYWQWILLSGALLALSWMIKRASKSSDKS